MILVFLQQEMYTAVAMFVFVYLSLSSLHIGHLFNITFVGIVTFARLSTDSLYL